MMKKIIWQLMLLIFPAALCFAASEIKINNAWVRAVPPSSAVTAAYMTIENGGEEADKVVGMTSPSSNYAEIHQSSVDEKGVAKMEKVEGIDVPAGESVMLKPGGYHIMLIELKAPLKTGDQIELDVRFEKAGTVKVLAEVRGGPEHTGGHMNH